MSYEVSKGYTAKHEAILQCLSMPLNHDPKYGPYELYKDLPVIGFPPALSSTAVFGLMKALHEPLGDRESVKSLWIPYTHRLKRQLAANLANNAVYLEDSLTALSAIEYAKKQLIPGIDKISLDARELEEGIVQDFIHDIENMIDPEY